MRYLPLAFDIKDRPCLIVGGGSVATRKGRLLAKAGARLLVVSPSITGELRQLVDNSRGRYIRARYHPDHLSEVDLVVAATGDRKVNSAVSADARRRHLPVNVVDAPDLCTFTFPAIVERGPLSIGISSGGTAPVLARLIRAQLEALLSPGIAALAELAGRFRDRVKAVLPEASRKDFWQWVFNGPVASKVETGKIAEGEAELLAALQQWRGTPSARGEVYLVGGGPEIRIC